MINPASILHPKLYELRDLMRAQGWDLRLVGGCVRDLMLGLTPKDVDLHTDATPDQQIQLYTQNQIRFEPTGLQHGTLSVIIDHVAYEITSLRVDTQTDGRHATVEYTQDWLRDLERRDFTFNAMSMSFEGDCLDPFGGTADLAQGMVRFVGDAQTRIREDYLRILRWFRFRGRFEKAEVDAHARRAVIQNGRGLSSISRERVWSEVSKIVAGARGPQLMLEIHSCALGTHLNLPPNPDWKVKAEKVHGITRNPVTIMVAMYGGWAHHILRAWKASNAEVDLACYLQHHKRANPFRQMAVHGVSREWALELSAFNLSDAFDHAVLAEWSVPVFPVSGYDLIRAGVRPGPQYGTLLSQMAELWADSDYTLTCSQLLSSQGLNQQPLG